MGKKRKSVRATKTHEDSRPENQRAVDLAQEYRKNYVAKYHTFATGDADRNNQIAARGIQLEAMRGVVDIETERARLRAKAVAARETAAREAEALTKTGENKDATTDLLPEG